MTPEVEHALAELDRIGVPWMGDVESAYRHLLAAGVHLTPWDVADAQRLRRKRNPAQASQHLQPA